MPARSSSTTPAPSPVLSPIISDPDGRLRRRRSTSSPIRAGSDGSGPRRRWRIDFTASTRRCDQAGGYVFLDIDQDPDDRPAGRGARGPARPRTSALEYFVDLFGVHDPEPRRSSSWTLETVRRSSPVPTPRSTARRSSSTSRSTAIGGDDGTINTAMVLGDFDCPSDWAPDEGHGTIEPFTDLPWLVREPESGTIAPGGAQVGHATLGGAEPRARRLPRRRSSSSPMHPKPRNVPVDVDLTVTMPDGVGRHHRDGHRRPQRRAARRRDRHAPREWPAAPLELTATTAADGTYSLVGPDGTGRRRTPSTATSAVTSEVTIVARRHDGRASTRPSIAIQPHAVLDGEPVVVHPDPGSHRRGTLHARQPGRPRRSRVRDRRGRPGRADAAAGDAASATRSSCPPAWTATPGRPAAWARGQGPRGPAAHPGRGRRPRLWPTGHDASVGRRLTTATSGSSDFERPHRRPSSRPTGERADRASVDRRLGRRVGRRHGLRRRPQPHLAGQCRRRQRDLRARSERWLGRAGDHRSPWAAISQRGLAYDPAADVFYIGGWNEGIVYRVAGPSQPTPGRDAQPVPARPIRTSPASPGTARSGCSGRRRTRETDTIWLHRPDDLRGQSSASRTRTAAASTAPASSSTPSATSGRSARTAATPTSSSPACRPSATCRG